jgi:predicted nucleic acid-binding protein
MISVLDASAGIAIVLEQEFSEVFREEIGKSEKVVASDLYKIEVANAIWKYVRAGELEKENINKSLAMAIGLVDEFVDVSTNNEESLNEAVRLNYSAYNMLYYTLTRRLGGKLLTKDRKLKELCLRTGVEVL